MTVTFCDLKNKEVVNTRDGKLLGCVCDVEFDVCTGSIISLVLPGNGLLSAFTSKNRICIPWCNIEKIGEDTVLVKYCDSLPAGK